MAKSFDNKVDEILAPLSDRHKRVIRALLTYREERGNSSPVSEEDVVMLSRDMRAILEYYDELVREELS